MINPRHTVHERRDMRGNGDMEFSLRIGLPHHPQCRQQVNGVAQKTQVEHHDFLCAARSLQKILLGCQICHFLPSMLAGRHTI